MFEVSQFDTYSYLFDEADLHQPRPERATPGSIPIAGLRIGVNGAEAAVGQAYRTLDTTITDSQYGPLGQPLANVGTVIALEKGPDADEFFLTFDVLGTHRNVRLDPSPLAPAPPADVQRPAGHRPARVRRTQRDDVRAHRRRPTRSGASQRPTRRSSSRCRPSRRIDTFVSAHPVAVAQLSIQYCNALVENPTARAQYFPGFDFSARAGDGIRAGGAGRSCSIRWSDACCAPTSRPSRTPRACAPISTR